MRKWIVAAGIALVAIFLALVVALHVMAPKLRAAVRQQTQDYLQSHFLSSVHFDDFEPCLGSGAGAAPSRPHGHTAAHRGAKRFLLHQSRQLAAASARSRTRATRRL